MAEGVKEPIGVGTTDPEEDSPNMIVYRKVRLTECYSLSSICWEKYWLRSNDPEASS